MLEEIPVTSYSLPSSPEMCAKRVTSEEELADENEIISPTLKAKFDLSASSTSMVVSPIAPAPSTKLSVHICCSKAVALGQIVTPIELPYVPAVRAAHSP